MDDVWDDLDAIEQQLRDKANEQQAMEPKVWRLEKHVFPPPATANRYCRAEMCLETDTAHEPWCGRHKTPNA